jgi:hypothetical protein
MEVAVFLLPLGRHAEDPMARVYICVCALTRVRLWVTLQHHQQLGYIASNEMK